jgi:hypothetical protein
MSTIPCFGIGIVQPLNYMSRNVIVDPKKVIVNPENVIVKRWNPHG